MPRTKAPSAERRPELGSFIPVAGRSVHVLEKGEGNPFVLLHGNASLGEEILSAFPRMPGVRWIAPDRPGYGRSDALPDGRQDPLSQAAWLEAFLTGMEMPRVTLVAHSLAAGPALAFAAAWPDRVRRLVLLAPFCRPTPQRLMLGLRLATAPVIGPPLRRLVVQPLVRLLGPRLVQSFMAPNPTPPWLRRFPVSHAAQPLAVATAGAELKTFNRGMEEIKPTAAVETAVTVVHGLSDRTAEPGWHLPWLAKRAPRMQVTLVMGCGHAVHHAAPALVLRAVLSGAAESPRAVSVLSSSPKEKPTDARPSAKDFRVA